MKLRHQRLPCAQASAAPPVVLVAGWAMPLELLQPLAEKLSEHCAVTLVELPGLSPADHTGDYELDTLVVALAALADEPGLWVGWSLGGLVIERVRQSLPHRVLGCVSVAVGPCFVANERWPQAMPKTDFADFEARFRAAPEATLRRFDALVAQGARAPREFLRQVRDTRPTQVDTAALRSGLGLLGQLDHTHTGRVSADRRLTVLGARDALVPPSAAPALASQVSAHVECWEGVGHALPVVEASRLAQRLLDFGRLLTAEPANSATGRIDKRRIAESFSRSASAYDSVAHVQRDVGDALLRRYASVTEVSGALLDLGCGTGNFQRALQQRFPRAGYLGLDLAEGMARYARNQDLGDGDWLVGDAESLPLADACLDGVFSSLAIQWCEQPERLFRELRRVIKPGATGVFSTLGPDTLHELRASWAEVDAARHVNDFLPLDVLQDAAAQAGLKLVIHRQVFCMRYSRVRDLLHDLKTLGAHNMNADRSSGLTGRRALQGMIRAYEAFREADGHLPATYDVIFGTFCRHD